MSSGSSGNGCGYAKLLRETTRVITRCGRRRFFWKGIQTIWGNPFESHEVGLMD